ncbi:polysaccharide deacetylase family protein (PEP-CTERM system associated) [Rhizomicrobium palustre]|uniref:Chitooligosaccharide deacetylase n=1 Tax=Rhizomicrobium palustre TaxID=189966 RepID=A0A846MTM5_9PROT|nr:XrtA system polysaccharide deacetylase [Rhizomicrobium palustre]NIK86703.1 polysaccharide deacetylase family protein (PEP-CTERM system associated) [Rhizomicrobium palustre]
MNPQSVIEGWNARPAAVPEKLRNAITVDVEDYFQVEAFFDVIHRDSWAKRTSRIERNMERVLSLFAEAKVHGTFFTLAWVAERFPQVVKAIVAGGHELASHGSDHKRADSQSFSEFLGDVSRAKSVLEDISGVAVKGYRAPSFSVMKENLWVMEALALAGYRYSSSTNPIAHDNYGIPEAPRFAFHPLAEDDFLEIPVTSLRWLGRNWPSGGGGYFRLLPFGLSRRAMDSVRARDDQPLVFYFHPWEIDAGQPRVRGASLKSRIRHYTNLSRMEDKLKRLLVSYQWGRMDEIFLEAA